MNTQEIYVWIGHNAAGKILSAAIETTPAWPSAAEKCAGRGLTVIRVRGPVALGGNVSDYTPAPL